MAERAGIPAGVLNILTGKPEAIGAALTASPVVRKLSFTGSTRIGALLAEQCAPTLKRLSLELGGNAPFVVFDDADLEAAVEGAMVSKFRNGGQTCVCANRIMVQSGIHDAFVAALAAKVDALTVGPGTEPDVAIGPMINTAAIDKINAHVADALDKGATRADDRDIGQPLPRAVGEAVMRAHGGAVIIIDVARDQDTRVAGIAQPRRQQAMSAGRNRKSAAGSGRGVERGLQAGGHVGQGHGCGHALRLKTDG